MYHILLVRYRLSVFIEAGNLHELLQQHVATFQVLDARMLNKALEFTWNGVRWMARIFTLGASDRINGGLKEATHTLLEVTLCTGDCITYEFSGSKGPECR